MVFALFRYNDDYPCDLFIFLAVCDTIEQCFDLIKIDPMPFTNKDVFIGSRESYFGKEKYIIEEVMMNELC